MPEVQELQNQAGQRSEQRPQTPTLPEQQDPRVAEYIHRKNDEVAQAFENAQDFLARLNAFKPTADAVEEIESEQINNPNPPEATGDPTDETTPSSKNQELQTNIWVNRILDMLGTPQGAVLLNELNINDPSRRLLTQLRTQLSPSELRQNTQGLPIVFKVLSNALNNNIDNPLHDALSGENFGEIAVINPRLHKRLTDAISEAAREPGGRNRKEINDFRRARAGENFDISTRNKNSYTEPELMRLFADKKIKENRQAELFYNAIRDGNIDDFINFYEDQVRTKLLDIADEQGHTYQEAGMTREQAEKTVTEDIHRTILYMVNSIFSTTLDRAPDEDFDKVARSLGSYGADPIRIFEETIASNLSLLSDNAQKYMQGNRASQIPVSFFGFKREDREYYSEKTKRIETTTVPVAELQHIELNQFITSLREIAEVERGALRYQFNFEYLMRNPPAADKGGLFGAIASYSRQLDTETLDNLSLLPYNEMIQAAVIGLETSYKRIFARNDWRKTTDLESDVFDHLPKAERQISDQLVANYAKMGVPAWAAKRAFYHARLMSKGKEFMMQLMSSYADPYLNDEGGQTFLGEPYLSKNSAYDIWDATKRWGDGSDLYLMGVPYMPANRRFEQFHPKELLAEGKKRWSESFTYGKMAYFDHEDFRESNPLIAMHNFSKMGGVDSYGGWRLKYAYMSWMSPLINEKNQGFNYAETGPTAFVDGWKSIDNIGIILHKNYMNEFLLNDGNLAVKDGKLVQEDKYAELFKFFYRRYFSEGVGKAMLTDINNEEQYWKMIRDKLVGKAGEEAKTAYSKEVITEQVYNAMTVQLYERSPLEFFTMEKKRSSQNGVTLRQELLEEFVGTKDTQGRWSDNGQSQDKIISERWEVALDDLTFVQQEARTESIVKMKENLEQSTDKNKLGILYGDLNNDYSSIAYKVDESFIDKALRKKYADDPDMEAKIRRAKELHQRMTEKIVEKPMQGILEKKWREEGKTDLANEATNSLQKRVKWFADAWRMGDLGMDFTSDVAGPFMRRAATGEELIARTAEASMFLAESAKNWVQGSAYSSLTDAIRKGRAGWETAIDSIKKFYETTKNEDKDRGKAMVKQFVNWMIIGLRRDTRYEQGLAKFSRQMEGKPVSLAGIKVGEGPEYSLDKQDVFDLVSQFVQGNILPKYTPGDEIKYKEMPPTLLSKMKAALLGGTPDPQLVRDYTQELSGEAARKMHMAGAEDLVNQNLLPIVSLMTIAILYALLSEAIEED